MIARSKLQPPGIKGLMIPRPDLMQKLDAALEHRLTLVTAPAGFGKTSLLVQWLEHSPCAAVWLNLDPFDNQPARFWQHLIASLQQLAPTLCQGSMELLSQPQLPPTPVWLTPLLNELYLLPETIVLIIQDYHLIEAAQVHESLGQFLLQIPARFHVVINSRSACKALPLSRLRAQQQLLDIRLQHLRFSPAEVEALFALAPISVPAELMEQIYSFSEGWVLALQMMLMCLQNLQEPQTWMHALSESQRQLQDYLLDEVIAGLPARLQDFMMQSSILASLNSELCNEVLAIHDSARCLQSLEQMHLFLTPADPGHQWWRYHELLAELLQQKLEQEQPERLAVLHTRAGAWYARQHQLERAIGHWLAAGADRELTDYLLVAGYELLIRPICQASCRVS